MRRPGGELVCNNFSTAIDAEKRERIDLPPRGAITRTLDHCAGKLNVICFRCGAKTVFSKTV